MTAGIAVPHVRWTALRAVVLLASLVLGACRKSVGSDGTPVVNLAVASSLADVMEELAHAFDRAHGTRCVLTLGATGALSRQIEHGMPVDVLVAASDRDVLVLVNGGVIERDSVAVFARGELVLWSPDGSVTALAQLARPEVARIAVANPATAPYGRAAVEALRRAGLWERVGARVVYASNVREAWQFARTGNADVAFVARTTVRSSPGSSVAVAAELYAPIWYTVGVPVRVAASRWGPRFVRWLSSAEARATLARFALQAPP